MVHARDDFWHKKYVESPSGEPARVFAGGANGHAEDEDHGVHLPSPSFFPLMAAFGLPVLAYGLIYGSMVLIVGGALVLVLGLYGWALEPQFAEGEHH
jgi:cytochrome c oxidase subunit 1